MLQRDKDIKKGTDIRRLLIRRSELWESKLFLELIQEAEICDKNLPKSYGNISDKEALKTFSRLIMQGRGLSIP